jgi:hypothetical protein
MNNRVLLILIMLFFPLSLLYGITIPAKKINFVGLAFAPKSGINKNYIETTDDIDFSNPIDWIMCDNDSIFYIEFYKHACR